MAVVRQKKQGGCCLFKIFLILLVLVALLIAGVIGSMYWGMNKLKGYGSPDPVALNYPSASAEEISAIQGKRTFISSSGADAERVAYNDRELNILIANDPDFAILKDHAQVAIKNNRLTLILSVPIDKSFVTDEPAPPGTLYMNAVAILEPDPAATHYLRVKVVDIKTQSKSVTEAELTKVEGFLNDVFKEVDNETGVPGSYITIEGGELIFHKGSTDMGTPVDEGEITPGGEVDPGPAATPDQLMNILESTNPNLAE